MNLSFVFLFAVLAVTNAMYCAGKCPKRFEPVCSANIAGEHATFNNMCYLKNAIKCYKKYKRYAFEKFGICQEDKNKGMHQVGDGAVRRSKTTGFQMTAPLA